MFSPNVDGSTSIMLRLFRSAVFFVYCNPLFCVCADVCPRRSRLSNADNTVREGFKVDCRRMNIDSPNHETKAESMDEPAKSIPEIEPPTDCGQRRRNMRVYAGRRDFPAQKVFH